MLSSFSYGHHGTTIAISPALQPLLRAYLLGYISITGPRLFGFLRVLSRRDVPVLSKLDLLYRILKTPTQLHRFPTACAITVGGATAFPRLVKTVLQWLLQTFFSSSSSLVALMNERLGRPRFLSQLRFITTFFSACLAFNLLNSDKEWSKRRANSVSLASSSSLVKEDLPNQHHLPTSPPEFAGKTIDFTLFALTRAIDAAVVTLWTTPLLQLSIPLLSSYPSQLQSLSTLRPTLTTRLSRATSPVLFALSAATIMHAWFYTPERLPKAYQRWISTAASIDPRLIETLRRVRRGEFLYGIETGQKPLLAPMCRELGLPEAWGDPVVTVPVPCELYHSGVGPSCEKHALSRFLGSFLFAMRLYLPINLASRLTTAGALTTPGAWTSLFRSSARSSAFLAAFVSSFYYAVCLARTRLGPHLIPLRIVTRQMWDSGLCVLAGCLACGWSVMIEHPAKRMELAFFVAPRALGTLLPRVYEKRHLKTERMVFALSVATVLSLLKDRRGKKNVRGVFGRILEGILKE